MRRIIKSIANLLAADLPAHKSRHAAGGDDALAATDLPAHKSRHASGGADALAGTDLPSHGAAQHTDRTRNMWIPAASFSLLAGSPSLALVHTATAVAWLLDDTASEVIVAQVLIPEDWASGTLTVKHYLSMAGANTSKVASLGIAGGTFTDGASVDAAAEFNDWASPTLVTVPDAANTLKVAAQNTTIAVVAGDLFIIRVNRRGTDVSDDAVGDLQYLGMEIEYTADM